MKITVWLIDTAKRNPLLFSLALLLIGISTMSLVIRYQTTKIDECLDDKKVLESYYNSKIDSIRSYHSKKEANLNQEVKQTLQSIIDDYKSQLKEQKSINKTFNKTLKANKKSIDQNNNQIEYLQQ